MFKVLDEICACCPPPEAPCDVLTPSQWNANFGAAGGRLPEELVQLNMRYGSGLFESKSSPINGSVMIYTASVSAYALGRLAGLRSVKLKRPKAFPASLYFEPGGLLPIGEIGAKLDICYRTAGDNPDKWTVSLLRASTSDVDHLKVPLVNFLRELGVCAAEPAIRGRTDVQVQAGLLDLGHELSAL